MSFFFAYLKIASWSWQLSDDHHQDLASLDCHFKDWRISILKVFQFSNTIKVGEFRPFDWRGECLVMTKLAGVISTPFYVVLRTKSGLLSGGLVCFSCGDWLCFHLRLACLVLFELLSTTPKRSKTSQPMCPVWLTNFSVSARPETLSRLMSLSSLQLRVSGTRSLLVLAAPGYTHWNETQKKSLEMCRGSFT